MKRAFVGLAGMLVLGLAAGPSDASGTSGSDTQPSARTGEVPSKSRRPRLVFAVLLVTVLLVAAGVVTYVVTRPPDLIDLKVVDGSTVGAIEGDLTTVGSNQTPLVLNFVATTYANETNGEASTLTLRLHTWTFFDSGGGDVEVDINATVAGTFAADLHPANLQLFANQTGPNGSLEAWAEQFGTNVSFDPGQSFGVLNGSGVLSATIVGGAYRFSYSDFFKVIGRPWYNRFAGFRVTVTGPFTPAVGVGILLKIINTNGGSWA